MTRTMKAIPTKWRGVQFRSRLEARWAAFFTALGWDWSYEPIDLDGYIPDFFLHMKEDVLVEVKPIMRLDESNCRDAEEKIRQSGYLICNHRPDVYVGCDRHEAVIVGAVIFDAEPLTSTYDAIAIGRMIGGDFAVVGRCHTCGKLSMCSDLMSFHCRQCGENSGNALSLGEPGDRDLILGYWVEAANEVQWRGSSARRYA